ncbi:MAG: 2Fe-2S iron-sulfur cluster binding domain-containing protein, partial [Myxococcota bacterium]
MRRLTINEHTVEPRSGETILQTALRHGIDFPHGCRVGGCGACKCKLADGHVTERTETGYLLTAKELASRTVLACQSVPRSDVTVEVELAPRGLEGTVVSCERVTHDITALTIALQSPLAYRAGQYAKLSIDGLEGVKRCYSFASPPDPEGRVRFLIRRVEGGAMSTLVNDEDLTGRGVRVDGPEGDFWLRPDDANAPLLFVAGGSGLAPILAILRAAVAEGVSRPAVLLFGAR